MIKWTSADNEVKMSDSEEQAILTKVFGMSESEVIEMQAMERGDIDGYTRVIRIDSSTKSKGRAA